VWSCANAGCEEPIVAETASKAVAYDNAFMIFCAGIIGLVLVTSFRAATSVTATTVIGLGQNAHDGLESRRLEWNHRPGQWCRQAKSRIIRRNGYRKKKEKFSRAQTERKGPPRYLSSTHVVVSKAVALVAYDFVCPTPADPEAEKRSYSAE